MEPSTQQLVFISYRQKETSGTTGRLRDSLKQFIDERYLFLDVESLGKGEKFPPRLKKCIEECEVFMVIIGPGWLSTLQQLYEAGAEDWVKTELQWAIKRKKIILPVLVQGAIMPSASQLPADLKVLEQYNAAELTHQRWKYDVEQIAGTLAKHGIPLKKEEKRTQITTAVVLILAAFLLVASFIYVKQTFFSSPKITPISRPLQKVAVEPAPQLEGRWRVLNSGNSNQWYQLSQNNYQLTVESFSGDKRMAVAYGFVNAARNVTFTLGAENGKKTNYLLRLSGDGNKLVGRLSSNQKIGNQKLYVPISWERVQ